MEIPIYYCFSHQIDKSTGWVSKESNARKLIWNLDTGAAIWQNVRYILEERLKIADKDYLVATAPTLLEDESEIKADQKLVLKRLPLDLSKGHKKFVPIMLSANLTEEEKIMKLLERAASQQQHASKVLQKKIRIAPAYYECNYCREHAGHYEADCPRKAKGMTSRKIPKGLPLTFLREAVTEEEKENAFLGPHGKLYVKKEQLLSEVTPTIYFADSNKKEETS